MTGDSNLQVRDNGPGVLSIENDARLTANALQKPAKLRQSRLGTRWGGSLRQNTPLQYPALQEAGSHPKGLPTRVGNGHTMIPVVRTVIADEQRLARNKLRILLSKEAGIQIVAECRDGEQTVAAVKAHNPDLLLLDTQMRGEDGFQVLNKIPPGNMPIVIFTSAFDQFAVRAFETNALDYLLKPFEKERLRQALDKARAELLKVHDGNLTHRVLDLLTETGTGPRQADGRLAIKAGGRVVFLDLDEIDWIEAAANYVRINVGKESYLLREAIRHVSERLDPARFVRIHRSAIVNVRKIKELQPCNTGEYIAILKDGKELSCGRTYRLHLQRLIEKNL